eukprot:CAMPEP_0194326164 /NCGR_PEP_ID=MMETSP0171-20130528/35038_1 /TAXON_ID=218684 /ORGANISM="Corethron pennatum, Strain L29A3" /LENGTH=43 /DNA_ID= /DNA_START= /DNA_END= /DNA_ORIENTATION=
MIRDRPPPQAAICCRREPPPPPLQRTPQTPSPLEPPPTDAESR